MDGIVSFKARGGCVVVVGGVRPKEIRFTCGANHASGWIDFYRDAWGCFNLVCSDRNNTTG
jgi:hypothetical protein